MPETPFNRLSTDRAMPENLRAAHEESRTKLLKSQRESSTMRNLNRDEKWVKTGKRKQIGREAKRELRGELEFHEAKERAEASPEDLAATRSAVRDGQLGKTQLKAPSNPRLDEMRQRASADPKKLAEMRDRSKVDVQRHQFKHLGRR
jgi:Cft2 family RNA processing exonuclease